tara:strand:- start:496 stop:717 length:222 start_codon:yes stop_codon:yes gene_type:complete
MSPASINLNKLKQNKSFDDIQNFDDSTNINILFEEFLELKKKYPLTYIYLFQKKITKKQRIDNINKFLKSTRK